MMLECAATGRERRKDPAKVRAALIEAAAQTIADQGLARLTIDAVAKAAGVTKGGLFHHFRSKDDLVQGVLQAMMQFASETIEAQMALDPEPFGRFTRAYFHGAFQDHRLNGKTYSRTFFLAILADPELQAGWSDWVADQVVRYAETEDNVGCALVRLAADGVWLNSLQNLGSPSPLPHNLYAKLIELTKPNCLMLSPRSQS